MRETISTNLMGKGSSKLELTSRHHGRKISWFYAKVLELLMRKTEADRRVELFGSDPFK
jgi:hypothetical protein